MNLLIVPVIVRLDSGFEFIVAVCQHAKFGMFEVG